MCWALLAFMISFNLFIPEMNDILTGLDAPELKGMSFTLFSITAALCRPFSGKLSDTIGRKKVMYIGIIIGFLVTITYPIAGLGMFLALRLSHGLSAGFLPTGATALTTDLLPVEGRGVAMGIWGTFISVGFGFGNFFSLYIIKAVGLTGLFMTAAGFAVFSAILISQIKETLPNPQKFSWSLLKVNWNDVFEPTVRPAAFVMFCSALSTGIMFVTTPDMSGFMGLENKGWFFIFYMSATIIIRLFASSLSDRIGRRPTLIIGLVFMFLCMIILGTSQHWIQYTIGAIVFGISTGITSPTVMAWMADLAPEKRRGVGSGTVFIALEFAIMAGSGLTLPLYQSTLKSLFIPYMIGSAMAIVAIIYLFWHLKRRESLT